MRFLVAVLVVLMGCAKHDGDPAPAPGSAKHGGPIKDLDDPAFVSAKRSAVSVALPYSSNIETGLHAVKVTLKKGEKIRVRVEQPTTTGALAIHQWWPTADGWGVASDEFTPAEPGASFETVRVADVDAETIIAVEAKSPAAFRLMLGRP